MDFIPRRISDYIKKATADFPSLLVTGPRRSGKTTLMRHLFPSASYVLLEDPDIAGRIQNDPRGFLEQMSFPVILDEIQNVPILFNYIRTRIDTEPEISGRFLLTGSQEAPLMRGVSESMAGRVAIFQLMPFSTVETAAVTLLHGGFPEVVCRPQIADTWFRSYLQTYIERDVRAVTLISDLATYRRFMGLVASRIGQIVNYTDLAAPLGVSAQTVKAWLEILETTGQILLVPPFYENFGKRLVKSPKLYFVDSGLACHLLGLDTEDAIRRSPFLGPLFEGYVAAEIAKSQINANRRREIYFFRDRTGVEIDFVASLKDRRLAAIECKASATVQAHDARSLNLLGTWAKSYTTTKMLVHNGTNSIPTIAPDVAAVTLGGLLETLEQGYHS